MNVIFTTVTVFISLCGMISLSECTSYRKLVKSLENEYKVNGINGIPATNSSVPLDIKVRFALVQILGFDQLHQVISLVGTLSTSWHDNLLTWNPPDFDDIDTVVIPPTSAWTPDIVLFNAVDRPIPTHDSMLKVTSNGDVSWVTKSKYRLSCATSPDEKEPSCDLKFGSWSMDADTIKLIPQAQIIDAGYYLPHHEWELSTTNAEVSTKAYPCCPGEEYSDITFTFNLVKREEEEEVIEECNSGRNVHVDIVVHVLGSLLFLLVNFL